MKTRYRGSFARDLKKLKEPGTRQQVMEVITEIKKAVNVAAIGNLKKMSVGRNHYRIRVGDYRLGVEIAGDTLIFVRCLHRRDIYRSFP